MFRCSGFRPKVRLIKFFLSPHSFRVNSAPQRINLWSTYILRQITLIFNGLFSKTCRIFLYYLPKAIESGAKSDVLVSKPDLTVNSPYLSLIDSKALSKAGPLL